MEITDSKNIVMRVDSVMVEMVDRPGVFTDVEWRNIPLALARAGSEGTFIDRGEKVRIRSLIYADEKNSGMQHVLTFQQYLDIGRKDRIEIEASYRIKPAP